MVLDFVVDLRLENRSVVAGSDALDLFDGHQTVGSGTAGFDAEFIT